MATATWLTEMLAELLVNEVICCILQGQKGQQLSAIFLVCDIWG